MKKKIRYSFVVISLFVVNINSVLAAGFIDNSEGTIKICGFNNMSPRVPVFTSGLFNIIRILVPIILIIMGMTDFLKAVMASDEDKVFGLLNISQETIYYSPTNSPVMENTFQLN